MSEFITDINGKKVEVTNLDEALKQARWAVEFHNETTKQHAIDNETFIFPQAQKEWEHILSELEKLQLKSVVCSDNYVERTKNPSIYFNTLKMMGVDGRQINDFVDCLEIFHLTINPQVKKKQRKTMLNTVIMDKTVKQWIEHFIKEAQKNGIKIYDYNLCMNVPFKVKDFDFENIEKVQIISALDFILQEFYKKEKMLG